MNPSHHVHLGKRPLRLAPSSSVFHCSPSYCKTHRFGEGPPKAAPAPAAEHSCRSEQDALPILDAVRAAGDEQSVHPFHIPGHKVGAVAGFYIHHSREDDHAYH